MARAGSVPVALRGDSLRHHRVLSSALFVFIWHYWPRAPQGQPASHGLYELAGPSSRSGQGQHPVRLDGLTPDRRRITIRRQFGGGLAASAVMALGSGGACKPPAREPLRSTASAWRSGSSARRVVPAPCGAVEEDPAAERLGAVLEANQAGAASEVGAPAAVVANRDAQGTGDGLDLDGGFRGVRVLRCVRQPPPTRRSTRPPRSARAAARPSGGLGQPVSGSGGRASSGRSRDRAR